MVGLLVGWFVGCAGFLTCILACWRGCWLAGLLAANMNVWAALGGSGKLLAVSGRSGSSVHSN